MRYSDTDQGAMIRFLHVWRTTTIQLPKTFEFTGKLTSMVREPEPPARQHTTSGGARNWMVGGFCCSVKGRFLREACFGIGYSVILRQDSWE